MELSKIHIECRFCTYDGRTLSLFSNVFINGYEIRYGRKVKMKITATPPFETRMYIAIHANNNIFRIYTLYLFKGAVQQPDLGSKPTWTILVA